jgi:uncharacterized protein (DUF433 family)
MAVTKHRIVSGEESEIHDEPHIEGSRVTVLHVHERVEERGLRPETVADRLNLDLADVYEALPTTTATPTRCDRSKLTGKRL